MEGSHEFCLGDVKFDRPIKHGIVTKEAVGYRSLDSKREIHVKGSFYR